MAEVLYGCIAETGIAHLHKSFFSPLLDEYRNKHSKYTTDFQRPCPSETYLQSLDIVYIDISECIYLERQTIYSVSSSIFLLLKLRKN